MKLHVCYGTMPVPKPGGHACKNARDALVKAGYTPEVKRAYGWGLLPDAVQPPQRKRIKQETGSKWVPALELDDGTWVSGSQEIIAWAKRHPSK